MKLYVAENLQFLKRSRNYTREQVSNFIGINVRSWDSYVEGRARPTYETIIQISDHFDVPVDQILRVDLKILYAAVVNYRLEKIEPKLTIDK